ncbi:MAG TPA: DUF1697 domain-containing protein [Ilumatobacter sp.]
MTRWIALLRGVNVGGGNKIAMRALRVSCEGCGFERVSTYIQSGNVVFEAKRDEAAVTAALRKVLTEKHGLNVPVVVRSAREMDRLADSHPGLNAGVEPRYLHIVFLDKKVEQAHVHRVDGARFDPDTFAVDGREIYVTYPNGSGRSKLTIEVFERAFGVTATARNVNTVRALVKLASGV